MAKALGLPPEQVPASASQLQKRLANFLPASVNLTAKSWNNALSDARAGLARYGVVERRYNRKTDLKPDWKRLWEIVLASGDVTVPKAQGSFIYFLNSMGVEPSDVRIEHAEAFREWLVGNEMHRDPEHSFRTAVTSWNLAVNRFPDWPRQTFALPSRAKVIKLKPEAFPATLAEDLERYLSGLSNPNIFDEEALSAPLRPASIKQYRAMLLRIASILTLAKIPIEEINDMSALVRIDHAEAGLRWMMAQTANVKTIGTAQMANVLRNLARRYVKVSEADQRRLDQLNDRLAVKQPSGMTPKKPGTFASLA